MSLFREQSFHSSRNCRNCTADLPGDRVFQALLRLLLFLQLALQLGNTSVSLELFVGKSLGFIGESLDSVGKLLVLAR